MKVFDTPISDLKVIEPKVFGDERGFFMETYQDSWFKENVAHVDFVQDNHSSSSRGILRGLHYQVNQPQGKLVRVISGEVYDVAVDLRKNSKTFGESFGIYLSAENKKQLWVPPGFAHGFYVTSENAEFVYRCTDYYAPKYERCILWNDLSLDIGWPISSECQPILSDKDSKGLSFELAEYYD